MTTTLSTVADRNLTYADICTQILAEIGAKYDGNLSALSRATGINRTQLIEYLHKGRDMGAVRMMDIIAALDLTEPEFFKRARERAGIPSKDA